jgi:DNA-binding MarR family transcriptional regulator
VRARPDPADQRRQVLELTDKGLQTTQRLEPLWEAIAAATREMLQQAAPGLEAEMERLEAALS